MSIIQKLVNLKNKRFVRDVFVLQAGSIFSTGLSFVGSVIYARVLGIEGYASYALIFAFVGIVSIFMHWGTDTATLTLLSRAYADNDKQKINDVLTYYIKITLAIYVVVGVIAIVLSPYLSSRLYSSAEIGILARIIILTNMIKVFWGMYTIVLQVVRKIKYLAIIENLNKIFYVAVPATLVLLGFGLRGLVIGHLSVAIFFAVVSVLWYRRIRKNFELFPPWRQIFKNFNQARIKYYFKFGFLIAVDKNLSGLYRTLPIFFLGIFSLTSVAHLKIAFAYAALPLVFVSAVGRLLSVQLPKSFSYDMKILKRDFLRSSIGSFLITLALAVVFAVLAPFLIPLVYGREFIPAVYLSYPLLVGTIISGAAVGLGAIYRTLNIMKKAIIMNGTIIVLGMGVVYWFIKNFSISVSVYAIAGWVVISEIAFFSYVIFYMNKKIKADE